MSSQDSKRQLTVILMVVFIGFIGASMAYPIFPPLFLHPQHGGIIPSSWLMNSRSILLGVTLGIYPLGIFIGSPIMGALSDRYGRKRILLINISATTVGYLLSALALVKNDIILLIASRFFTGLMSGDIAIARSMAADLPDINKQKSFGLINGVASIAYVIGPLTGGVLADNNLVSWFSFDLPFFAAALTALVTLLFAIFKLPNVSMTKVPVKLKILPQFNIVARLRGLFQNRLLRYVLISSTIFTLAIDIFYEFGPVYLAGQWQMNSAQIALYSSVLSVGLAIGSSWLPSFLADYYSPRRIIVACMFVTSLIVLLIVLLLSKTAAFILFALIGFSIACGATVITVQLSDVAGDKIQGEVLGTQLGLRMLGDAIICVIGGVLIISSVAIPLVMCSIVAFIAAVYYLLNFTVKRSA